MTAPPALSMILTVTASILGCQTAPKERHASDVAARAEAASATPLPSSSPAPERGAPPEVRHIAMAGPFGPMPSVVVVPPGAKGERFPVLVTFHGRGEALKPPDRGARGWVDDYRLLETIRRLHSPPLVTRDFKGMVTPARLAELNAALDERPYRDLIVVCPYLPDILRGASAFRQAPALAAFVTDQLLPRIHETTPSTRAVAIDGVSLGGRAALLVGLSRPEVFGSIGALQAALDTSEIPRFVELATNATRKNPNLRLRLLTSDQDYFLRPVIALSRALRREGVDADLDVVSGTHDYDFNRGPGGFEMLIHHDDALGR